MVYQWPIQWELVLFCCVIDIHNLDFDISTKISTNFSTGTKFLFMCVDTQGCDDSSAGY